MTDDVDLRSGGDGPPAVLVVDADPMFALLVEACLGAEGSSVEHVTTLAEAVAALRPQLTGAVVDPALPDGDGLDLLALFGQHCPGVPLVVCTESGVGTDDQQARLAGTTAEWLPKSDLARITEVLGSEPELRHLPTDRLLHISALDLDNP